MLEALNAVTATLGGLLVVSKGATELTQQIKGLFEKSDVDPAETKQLVSDLLDRLLRIQAEQFAMQSALRDLQEELRKAEHFQTQMVRYALEKTELGALLYTLKPEHAGTEPPHSICAACYQDRVISILQPVAHNTLGCGKCGGKFLKPDGQGHGVLTVPARRGSIFDGY